MADAVIQAVTNTAPVQVHTILVDLVGPGAARALIAADEAEEDAQSAAENAVAAAASAAAADASSDTAGAYLAGVLDAIDGLPLSSTLPLQATSISILQGFTGMTDGRQALLVDGRGPPRLFTWSSANHSANVTADPLKVQYVPRTINLSGSSGAWVYGMEDGIAYPEWAGAAGDATFGGGLWSGTNDTAAFDAVLNNSNVKEVRAFGRYMIDGTGGPIIEVVGKILRGAGPAVSGLYKIPLAGAAPSQLVPAIMVSVRDGGQMIGLEINGQKSGLGRGAANRTHGWVCQGQAFVVEDCWGIDVHGYACWVNGQAYATGASGRCSHIVTENCEVHLEAIHCDGVLFENAVSTDGDADIGCEAKLHTYGVVDNIIFRNCRAYGQGQGYLGGTGLGAHGNVTFEHCDVEVTTASPAFIIAGGGPSIMMAKLKMIDCRFASPLATGGTIDWVTTTDIVSSRFEGATGFAVGANCGTLRAVLGRIYAATDPGGASVSYALYVYPGPTVTWDGHLEATGPSGSTALAGAASLSVTTTRIPPPPSFSGAFTYPVALNNTTVAVRDSSYYLITKTGGTDSTYNADAKSFVSLTGDFTIRIIVPPAQSGAPVSTLTSIVAGVSVDPTVSANQNNIAFGLNTDQDYRLYAAQSGVFTPVGVWMPGVPMHVQRRGSTIALIQGPTAALGETLRTATLSGTVWFDCSIYKLNGQFLTRIAIP